MLLAGARALRPPLVYVSIGLPHRLAQLRTRGRAARLRARVPAHGRRRRLRPRRGGGAARVAPGPRRALRPLRRRHRRLPPAEVEPDGGRGLRRRRSASGTTALLARVAARCRAPSFSVVASARPGAGAPTRRERRRRGRTAVRRGAGAARPRARRRAARAGQPLLGRDDDAPAGDGAGEAGRRLPHGGDRGGLRPRGRRERPARAAGRRGRVRGGAARAARRRRTPPPRSAAARGRPSSASSAGSATSTAIADVLRSR